MALASERDELLSRLIRLGCVEVNEPDDKLSDPKWAALVRRDSSKFLQTKSDITEVNTALTALKKYGGVKDGLFIQRSGIAERDFLDPKIVEDAKAVASEINGELTELSKLQSMENRLNAKRAGLLPWKGLDVPMEMTGTEHVLIQMGVCPAGVEVGEVKTELAAAAPESELYEISADREQRYLLFLCHRSQEEKAMEVLRSHGYNLAPLKEFTGTPDENITRLDRELAENAQAQIAVTAKIASHMPQRELLRTCADRLTQEAAKDATADRFLTDGTIVFFEGWAPAESVPELEKLFREKGCAWEFEEPQEEEEPPVKLKNSKFIEPINMVTEMYSLPAYRGIDPNPLIFWFYVAFFGFMFADIAYGIIIFLVSYLITEKFHPKKTIGYMFRLGQYLGVSTTVFGVLTGSFFGDVITVFSKTFLGKAVSLPYLLNPLQDPMKVLITAICMGIVQLIFGQCIHIYMGFRDGHGVDNLLDVVPWWVVFAGIGMAALGRGPSLIIAGAVILVCTQGRHKKGFFGKLFGGIASLYDITSWLSDILSYSRLMALMLATSVIASVMNTLGALPGKSFIGFIVFVLVFCLGHVFNIGVNIIGTYVHAARLQYLEFFGKFYVEGGVAFRPLEYDTKYVDIIKEEK